MPQGSLKKQTPISLKTARYVLCVCMWWWLFFSFFLVGFDLDEMSFFAIFINGTRFNIYRGFFEVEMWDVNLFVPEDGGGGNGLCESSFSSYNPIPLIPHSITHPTSPLLFHYINHHVKPFTKKSIIIDSYFSSPLQPPPTSSIPFPSLLHLSAQFRFLTRTCKINSQS